MEQCIVCSEKVNNLKGHLRSHTTEVQRSSSNFTENKDIHSHVKGCENRKAFKCKICDQIISREGNLERHFLAHKKEKVYKCNVCPVWYSTSKSLRNHKVKEHKIYASKRARNTYECDVCKTPFFEKHRLSRHVLVHKNERRYKCDICQKMLKTKESLNMHKKRHEGDAAKKFKCGLCEKTFLTKAEMESHLRSHIGEKPIKCECGKSFPDSWALQSHKKTHAIQRERFKCILCNGDYSCEKYLRSHLKTVHSSARPHQCVICQKEFKTRSDLNKHLKIVHIRVDCRFCCVFCSKGFHTNRELFRHLMSHVREKPFSCPSCDATYSTRTDFQRHMRTKSHFSRMRRANDA